MRTRSPGVARGRDRGSVTFVAAATTSPSGPRLSVCRLVVDLLKGLRLRKVFQELFGVAKVSCQSPGSFFRHNDKMLGLKANRMIRRLTGGAGASGRAAREASCLEFCLEEKEDEQTSRS